MSLTLTTPKKQLYKDSKIYYVSSESGGDKHIVVRVSGLSHKGLQFFCDCKDFFVRRLPSINTSVFSLCKHAKFCRDAECQVPYGKELERAFGGVVVVRKRKPELKYRVFLKPSYGSAVPSVDISDLFDTREDAQAAINCRLNKCSSNLDYEIHTV